MIRRASLFAVLAASAGAAQAASSFGVNTYAFTRSSGDGSYDFAGYDAQLQGGAYGVVAFGPFASQLSSAHAQGDSGAASGVTSASPALTSAADTATTTANATATAYGAADLATGALRASASGGAFVCCGGYTYNTGATGYAALSDGLTFRIPGATASTVTDIAFTIVTDGTFGGQSFGGGESIVSELNVAQAGQNPANFTREYAMDNVNPPKIQYDNESGWVSYSVTGDAGRFVFQGIYAAVGADPYLAISQGLKADGASGLADYAHTAQISLQLPSGVTYVSDSGVFLTAAAGAPEPAGWAALLVGLGLAGATLRRARRTPGAAAA